MTADSIHFRTDDSETACGRHKNRGRRYVARGRTTRYAPAVDCASCQRTRAFRQEVSRLIQQREDRRADVESRGFDPSKPLAEMTEEEVRAAIAAGVFGKRAAAEPEVPATVATPADDAANRCVYCGAAIDWHRDACADCERAADERDARRERERLQRKFDPSEDGGRALAEIDALNDELTRLCNSKAKDADRRILTVLRKLKKRVNALNL